MRKYSTAIFVVVALLVALGLDFALPVVIRDGSIRQLVMLVACNVVVALSLNVINGMAGQFSIGHAGFLSLGAYTSAVLSANMHEWLGGGDTTFGKSFIVVPVCLIASAIVGGAFGFIVGLPSLRLKGDYLAIVTLGFAEIVRLVIGTAQVQNSAGQEQGGWLHGLGAAISNLGGQNGYMGPRGEGLPLYAGPFWILGIAVLAGVAAWRLKFSGWGRALRALREDEIAAAAVGVDPTRYKVTSFVIAAVGGAVAGGMIAQMRDGSYLVNPETYNFSASFDAITMVILGGSGSVSGAILGAVFVTVSVKAIELLQNTSVAQLIQGPHMIGTFELKVDLNALRMIVYAVVLIALMIRRPEGLFGEREIGQKKREPKKPAPPTPAPVAA